MRPLLSACLLLCLAAPAMAQDRYGPQSAARAAAATMAPAAFLSWPGKVSPAAAPVQINEPMRPVADGLLRHTSAYSAPVPQPAPTVVASNNTPPPVENAPWRRLTGVQAAPRPTAAPVAMEEVAPAAPPQPVAGPAPTAAPQRSAAAAGEQARYYSLHREYGETPDAIAPPDKRQVFLAGGPLTAGVGGADEAIDTESTGRTAALNKARLAADWGSSNAK